MEYFVSHLGVILLAAVFVAVCAVAWWYLTERNAMLIRQRAEARRKAEAGSSQNSGEGSDKK